MRMLQFILPLLLLAAAGSAWAQPGPGTLEQLRSLRTFSGVQKVEALHAAATLGVTHYRALVNAESYKMMGLEQASDAEKAQLGTPSRDYIVRLDALKNYKSGDDPEKLLVDSGVIYFPLVVDGKTRSAVTMSMQQGEWKVVAIGQSSRAQKRSLALQASAKRLNKAENEHFIVRVPAMNLEFGAARDSSNQLQLTPILDYPEWGMKAGVSEPASAVFAKLAPSAQTHDGLPH